MKAGRFLKNNSGYGGILSCHIFIGIIMTGKLKKLFIQYIEDRVAEEADIMAQTAEEKFENEFQELRQIAYILQKER